MKREEVKAKIPGITDEQLDWIMGENGREINAERNKAIGLQGQVEELTTQLNTAKEGLKVFEGVDVADLRGQITKLKDQLNDQADGFAFDTALDGAIRDRKGRDVQAIRGIPLGAYWYAYWSKGTPADECRAFLAAVSGKKLEYGVWYDTWQHC